MEGWNGLTIFGIVIALTLFFSASIFVCKWIFVFYYWIRGIIFRTNYHSHPTNMQSTEITEHPQPNYEDGTGQASALTTGPLRRRSQQQSQQNIPLDNINNDDKGDLDTQLDKEATGDGNTGDDDTENVNSATSGENDTDLILIIGEDNIVKFRSTGEKPNKPHAEDDSVPKSSNSDARTNVV